MLRVGRNAAQSWRVAESALKTQVRCKTKVKAKAEEGLQEEDREASDSFSKRAILFLPKDPPKLSPEYKTLRYNLGRDLARGEFQEHRQREQEDQVRIKLKWAALHALPTPLREAAMIPDTSRLPKIKWLLDFPPEPKSSDQEDVQVDRDMFAWRYTSNFRDD
jgi:hypothetical protein